MQTVASGWLVLRQLAQRLGPYVLLEILLPGGTLLGLLLFLYRRWRLTGVAASLPAVAKRVSENGAGEGVFSGLQRWYRRFSGTFQPRACPRPESRPST